MTKITNMNILTSNTSVEVKYETRYLSNHQNIFKISNIVFNIMNRMLEIYHKF